ncbi:hypothetical protein [Mucilaginibacter lappiensis]|uniref:hypothetical protein n=1 Tax=Mucilaginibacter lappiensis TaxID=354630 RepID=UPI003D211807
MKNSIKISVLTLALFSFFGPDVKAQSSTTTETYGSGIRLSIGADAGIPVGSLRNGYRWAFGGSAQADFPLIKDELYITLNSGYNNIFAKNSSNLNDIHLIPVKAGLKYFPVKIFYVQGEAGASFLTNNNKAEKSATFVYAPQIGVLLPVGGKSYIDAGFRFEGNTKFYEAGKSSNFLALRIAYAFSL